MGHQWGIKSLIGTFKVIYMQQSYVGVAEAVMDGVGMILDFVAQKESCFPSFLLIILSVITFSHLFNTWLEFRLQR